MRPRRDLSPGRIELSSSPEQFVFQEKVHHSIGTDLSSGMVYRPLLSNNIVMKFGVSTLLPGRGFKDLYSNANSDVPVMVAGFLDVILPGGRGLDLPHG